MKRICIIYTGGTIGMERGENGYEPGKEPFADIMARISDFSSPELPEYDVIEFSPLLDSSDITVSEWNLIGETISKNMDNYDGFVVLHGTDTMAYTASALSFMLRNLKKPVIVTGSQSPLCEIRSDGKDNILASMMIAASEKVFEVCIFFAGKLLRGNRSIKKSADSLIAFDSPNYPKLADAGIGIKFRENVLMKKNDEPFVMQKFLEEPIGVIKIFPGIQIDLFEPIITSKLRGIVLETFGAGNVPNYCTNLTDIIKKAYEHGNIVVVCSQCPTGTVSLGHYAASSPLKKAGAVSGKNMTTETAVAKLYYLLSCGYSKEKIEELMEKDICGELD
ncbi:MAG: asparaginase [Oscillospiraceae bacterium]|nr:asparaginase [Oscillospiraceae bacterium]